MVWMITYHPDDYLQNYQNYLLLKQPKYLALACLKGPAPVTRRSCKIGGQCYIVSLHQHLLPHMVVSMKSVCLLRTDGLTVADLRKIPSGDDDHINIQTIGGCAVSLWESDRQLFKDISCAIEGEGGESQTAAKFFANHHCPGGDFVILTLRFHFGHTFCFRNMKIIMAVICRMRKRVSPYEQHLDSRIVVGRQIRGSLTH